LVTPKSIDDRQPACRSSSGSTSSAVAACANSAFAWVAGQVAAGQPEFMARLALGLFQAADQGFFAGIDPLLGQLLGREPQTVRDLLA
jgi:hypothetical protein